MNSDVAFEKWTGAGNDFILVAIDDLPTGLDPGVLAKQICSRSFGVGADGLLLIDSHHGLFWNNDGSPAAFCGNASRCLGRYLLLQKMKTDTGNEPGREQGCGQIDFRLGDIDLSATVEAENIVTITIPAPQILETISLGRLRALIPESPVEIIQANLVDAGVPHLILQYKIMETDPPNLPSQLPVQSHSDPTSIQAISLAKIADAVNESRAFAPVVINVNLVQAESGGQPVVSIRTWERGVNGETLACGSGALAAAAAMGDTFQTIRLQTRGGAELEVEKEKGKWRLRGPAVRICRGVAELKSVIKCS